MGYFETYEAQNRGEKPYVGANVRFKLEAIPDEAQSRIAGRPIYKDVEMIEIRFPGQAAMVFQAEDKHRRYYPEEYKAFKAGQEAPVKGLPLEQWAMPTKAIIENLKTLGFRTVEQLADAKDDVIHKMRSMAIWVKHAQDYMESCKADSTTVIGLKAELEHFKNACKSQQEMITQLLQRIDANEGTGMAQEFAATAINVDAFSEAPAPVQSEALSTDPIPSTAPKRRGRPKKVEA